MSKKFMLSLLMISVFAAVSACKKTTDDTEAVQDSIFDNAETAMSEAGAQASATEGASSPDLMSMSQGPAIISSDFINPQDELMHTQSACTYSSVRSACGGSGNDTITIDWGGCTIGTIKMTGGWTEKFSTSSACTAGNLLSASNTDYVDRSATSSVATFASGATFSTDTQGGTAWDNTAVPAGAIRVTKTSPTSRSIGGNPSGAGVHKTLTGPHGTTWFNYYIVPALVVSGTRAGGDRVVSGNVGIYHNLAHYDAIHTFNSVKWGSSSCCYPTSGNISSSYVGTVSGSSTLTFSSTCGSATFTDTAGSTSQVTLTKCQ